VAIFEALKEGTIFEKKRAGRVIFCAMSQLENLGFYSSQLTMITCEAPLAAIGVKISRLAR